jgi:hypothetical protein
MTAANDDVLEQSHLLDSASHTPSLLKNVDGLEASPILVTPPHRGSTAMTRRDADLVAGVT